MRRLAVGDDIHMAMLGKVALQRPQAEAKFFVVAKAPLHVAVNRHGVQALGVELRSGLLAFEAPGRVVAIHP